MNEANDSFIRRHLQCTVKNFDILTFQDIENVAFTVEVLPFSEILVSFFNKFFKTNKINKLKLSAGLSV